MTESAADPAYTVCELRQMHENRYICLASGGMSLAEMAFEQEMPADVCDHCDVPEQMAIQSCLYHVPVKIRKDQQWLTAFLCRWYYSLSPPEKLFRYYATTEFCIGCRDWYPRPPLSVIKDYLAKTREMISYCTSPPESTKPLFSSWRNPLSPSRREMLLTRIKKLYTHVTSQESGQNLK